MVDQGTGTQAVWCIELLGALRAVHGDRQIAHFRTQKTAALLGYLARHRDRLQPREVLVELLWPEDDPDAGRHKLSVALSALRQQLEPPGVPDGSVLTTERAAVGFVPGAVETDVDAFEDAVEAATRAAGDEERIALLTRSVRLYRGEFLSGQYDDWI